MQKKDGQRAGPGVRGAPDTGQRVRAGTPGANYRFAHFELQPRERRLLSAGEPTDIRPRAFDLLVALVTRAGELVTKDELLGLAWPNLVVEENNLQVQVSALRKILGDEAISTATGRGYRFTLAIERVQAVSSSPAIKHNLPQQVTSFIGRERELTEVKALLANRRLVTLVGAGGIGKTRMSVEVAASFVTDCADGVWFIDLAPITDPRRLASTFARVLAIDVDHSEPTAATLTRCLEQRDLLLVVDNCEHLIAASSALVEALLQAAPQIQVLVTSREPLAIAGEQIFQLQPLAVPERKPFKVEEVLATAAVRLFVERAVSADSRFEINDRNALTVAAICRRLDGIPLAIEMAAARTRIFGVAELEQELDECFHVLTSGRRTALPRQQTLRATLDWSHDLLTTLERAVFRKLAIFVGGFTLSAASAVASSTEGGFDLIEPFMRLVECSLVVADRDDAGTRYRLLETTRAYAWAKLAEVGESGEIARKHAEYCCSLFDDAPNDWLRMSGSDWSTKYLPELDNVRAALDWAFGVGGDAAVGVALTSRCGAIWSEALLYDEGQRRLEDAVVQIATNTPETEQARLWLHVGLLGRGVSPTRWRHSWLDAMTRSVDIYRRGDDKLALGYALVRLGRALAMTGRLDQAESALTEALPMLESANMPRPLGEYFGALGLLKTLTGDPASARMHFQMALSQYRSAKAEKHALSVLSALANTTWALGDLDAALAEFRESVELRRRPPLNAVRVFGIELINLAGVHTERGEFDEALAATREGLPLLKGTDNAWKVMDHVALRAALTDKIISAGRLAGFVDSHHIAREWTRLPNEARAHDRLHTRLREELLPDQLVRLLAEGATLTEEEAITIALEG